MNNINTFSVIGGDSRLIYAAEYLQKLGSDVSLFANEHGRIPEGISTCKSLSEALESDVIILPLPLSKNSKYLNSPLSSQIITLKELTDSVTEKNIIFLGMGSPSVTKQLSAKALSVYDYFTIETLTYKNALLTAEGLLGIILEKLPVSVNGMKIGVAGYGRIGALLCDMLNKLGADVTVFARNEVQRLKAELTGCKAEHTDNIRKRISDFACIVNTVPCRLIDDSIISASSKDCVFIEAASAPYGIDAEGCIKNNRALIKAFSLPGKTAPVTAGKIIGETVINCLKEV